MSQAIEVRNGESAIYPCAECGAMRTKSEGGTVFTICEECWKKYYPPKVAEPPSLLVIAADQLAEEWEDELLLADATGENPRYSKVRTALANYKRVRGEQVRPETFNQWIPPVNPLLEKSHRHVAPRVCNYVDERTGRFVYCK